MKYIFLALVSNTWYIIKILLFPFLQLVDKFYKDFRKLTKGSWLPEKSRYTNLLYGQWCESLICKIINHNFVDPRIDPYWIKKESQKWEKCTNCGYERKL